jgi:hypothetical protein
MQTAFSPLNMVNICKAPNNYESTGSPRLIEWMRPGKLSFDPSRGIYIIVSYLLTSIVRLVKFTTLRCLRHLSIIGHVILHQTIV